MDASVRQFVRQRAGDRCEYCRLPQDATPLVPRHIEHVVAQQHDLDDRPQNLALACDRCNAFKGTNLSTIDPATGDIELVFHPRSDTWRDHFEFDGPTIIGVTAKGRATVRLLQMNAPRRVELRQELLENGETL